VVVRERADERLVSDLEAVLADVGALLVRAQKYRGVPEQVALRAEALALGDTARRHHRRDTLDPAAARDLLAAAKDLLARGRRLLARVHASEPYRAAVAAHAAGEQATLARVLPAVFEGLEPAPSAPDLFHAVAWTRRGRPRRPLDVAADAARLHAEGIEAEGDDLTPGTDPDLPVVTLASERPDDEPVVLHFPAAALPVALYRLADTGAHLAYVRRLRASGRVLLAPDLGPDVIEVVPVDYPRYRADLAAALAAAGVPVTHG
jgi:hypothetical protein